MSSLLAPVRGLEPERTNLFVRRFTLDEYHRLIEIGMLKPDDPYELLNGVIKFKMPQNTPHASTSSKLEKRFWKLLPDDCLPRTQKPITIPSRESETEPDLAIVAGPEDRYDDEHPFPRDVLLIVEVASTSLDEDRGEKRECYAASRIPIYWIVNLKERVVEVHSQPRTGKKPGYRQIALFLPGDTIPVVLGKKTVGSIPVNEILP